MKRTSTTFLALVALAALLALPGALIAHPPGDEQTPEEIAAWAERWAEWGEELGERWAKWGEEFGERFGEEWGEEFARRWEERAEEMASRAEDWEQMGERWEEMGADIERDVLRALEAVDWERIAADVEASLEGLDELELERIGERLELQMQQLERQLEQMERRLEKQTP